jgi:hypothetical protein
VFTRHTLERMMQRGITESEVQMALSDSSAEDSPNGHGNRVIKKQFDKRVLRVHFRMSNADRLVVTAYWTSKTKKYAS